MATTYDAYSDAIAVYNAKSAWNNATTDEERKRQNEIANAARQRLNDNGFGYIAKQISADGATLADVESVLKNYAPSPEIANNVIKSANSKDYTKKYGQTIDPTPTTTTKPTTTTTPTTTNGGAKTGSDYDPYPDVQAVYNAKVAWNNATTDEERKRQNEIANAARKRLADYGYADLATQIGADEATATTTRKLLDSYAPPTNTKYSTNTLDTGIDNEAYNNRISSASTKSDVAFGTMVNDHADINGKYNNLYNYANSDITQTDEYKSAFKNIMPGYSLAAMQGRDNAVASGGASNGGNIDSYAAANAMRQQAALTAKGQALAHQIGLESANARINNVNTILSNLGVYNSSVYEAMDKNINTDRTLANDIAKNEQDALNYETARLAEEAAVTGYTPSAWVIKNDDVYSTYLNEDGTFKKEMENVDIQALINSAKASGDTETANKLAVVRAKKMIGNWDTYGQYANEGDISYIKPQKTATTTQAEADNKLAYYNIDKNFDLQKYLGDIGLKGTVYTADKGLEATKDTNATSVTLAEAGIHTKYNLDDIVKMLKNTATPSQELIDAYNKLSEDATKYTVDNPPPMTGQNVKDSGVPKNDTEEWDTFVGYFSDDNIANFLNKELKIYFDSDTDITDDFLEKLICGDDPADKSSNTSKYALDVEDIKQIIEKLNAFVNPETPLTTDWLNSYTNRWDADDNEGIRKKFF